MAVSWFVPRLLAGFAPYAAFVGSMANLRADIALHLLLGLKVTRFTLLLLESIQKPGEFLNIDVLKAL